MINAKLWVPDDVWVNMMPPVPQRNALRIQVTAFLTNQSQELVTLFSPTPCDVDYWEIKDQDGKLVAAEEPQTCIKKIETTTIAPGQTLRGDSLIEVNSKLFAPESRYTVFYRFWGQECSDSFTVHWAH